MTRQSIRGLAALVLSFSLALLGNFSSAMAGDTRAAPALWKIDTGHGTIYLFGSFHILPRDLQWRTPELDAALNTAQQLDFEINMDEAQDPARMGALIRQFGFLPEGQSLHRMLATEYRAKLDAELAELGLPPQGVDRMRPWLVALTITSLSALKHTSKPGEKLDPGAATGDHGGADIQLWNWAKANNKLRGALETLDSQIHIFSDLSREQEIQYLIVTLQQTGKLDDDLEKLLRAWTSGDLNSLDKELNADANQFPQLHQALLTDRHAKWIPEIEAMMNDGRNHVVIVGAAHLVGKGSVIDLLRSKGIRVAGP